jgi:ATP-dependent helicase Lhr and Lhr-like helicase
VPARWRPPTRDPSIPACPNRPQRCGLPQAGSPRFPGGPTRAQAEGWPSIRAGGDTLIAAPTGSGKTLAAFLVAVDQLYADSDQHGQIPDEARVIYVSPLKALAVDIQQNLERTLVEISKLAREQGRALPELRVGVRTGDTPPAQRAAMLRRPPHLLVTTPESLYLLLSADRSRRLLAGVRTLIVDEIHALARDKRGSHLALSLERLDHVCRARPTRIGLSATQRPIEQIARLLSGAARPAPTIVDLGHQRSLELIERALWECVARGLVTADGFAPLRSLLAKRKLRLVRLRSVEPGRGADTRPARPGAADARGRLPRRSSGRGRIARRDRARPGGRVQAR